MGFKGLEYNIQTTDKEIFEFPVLWAGWDCDGVAWIMERKDGSRYLKMTNHGEEYEAPISDLTWKIDEYESVIIKTKQAIEIVKVVVMICYDSVGGSWRSAEDSSF